MLNENNEVVFNYQVNTIMPIIGLSVGNLMVPSTAKLTKEDVLICILFTTIRLCATTTRFSKRKLHQPSTKNCFLNIFIKTQKTKK